jgi:predicted nucleotidyltransferase
MQQAEPSAHTLNLPAFILKELLALLAQHVPQAQVWAYGSRVTGGAQECSDLDLVLCPPSGGAASTQYLAGLADLQEALQRSSIPILVDVHVWEQLPESFQQQIRQGCVALQA